MIKYHLLNIVKVLQPRWHDRVILPRVDKFKIGGNIITIKHRDYPSKYYMTQKEADTYPQETKQGRFGEYQVYVIPLTDLITIQEHEAGLIKEKQDIVNIAKELFDV